METSTFLDVRKRSVVIPIPKKTVDTLSDLHPISVLPTLTKVLEKLLHERLLDYLNAFNIFSA